MWFGSGKLLRRLGVLLLLLPSSAASRTSLTCHRASRLVMRLYGPLPHPTSTGKTLHSEKSRRKFASSARSLRRLRPNGRSGDCLSRDP